MSDTVKIADTAAAPAPKVFITIGDNQKDLGNKVDAFQWSSFMNGGYIIRCKLRDPNHALLKSITIGGEDSVSTYLQDSRRKPVPIKFKLIRDGDSETDERLAYLTNLKGYGISENGVLEFIGIDPPGFLLNAGTASGAAYKGKVSDVIKKVIGDFTNLKVAKSESDPGNEVFVTVTQDSAENYHWMNRMDPRTFINSLLEWSSPLTPKKSKWIVSSRDRIINIKEEAELKGEDFGTFHVTARDRSAQILEWDCELNNFVSVFQTNLATGGISATSGQYYDVVTAPKDVLIDDESTGAKVNSLTKDDTTRSFAKPGPSDNWPAGVPVTFIKPIPEYYSAGDIGKQYGDYISGRARQLFMNMVNMVMRIAVKTNSLYALDNSELLGVSTCTLNWAGDGMTEYFMGGKWILYGFRHEVTTRRGWETILYLYRIDYDAESTRI